MTRLFIALPVDEAIRIRLFPLHQFFCQWSSIIKPVSPSHYHITMKFIGDCEGSTARAIEEAFMDVPVDTTALEYTVKGIGMFPGEKNPSVIWTGLQTDLTRIRKMLNVIESFTKEFGIRAETRSFIPHLTIGRVKKGRKLTAKMYNFLEQYRDTDFGSSIFTRLILYQSTLTPKGPEYTVRKELPLAR
ncbi:MAG: RNA 2',3'-cyclic phosphodiesterase [Spirochaetota bacterium]